MEKFLLLFTIILLGSKVSYSQWIMQSSGVDVQLRDVKFIDTKTGWICGDEGTILKTTNGGNNWIIQNSGINDKILSMIYPVNDSIVYCVGYFETILKTSDGGENWQVIENGQVGQSYSYYSVFFLNENTGWIGSTELATKKTTDGGQTFIDQFVLTHPRDIYFKDSLEGVFCAWGAEIGITTNGGDNWTLTQYCTPGIGCEDFDRISFVNNSIGYVAGREGTIFKTTNFGITWDSISFIEENIDFIRCVEFINDSLGWAGGGGQLFKTTNGGLTWRAQIIGPGLIPSIYSVNDTLVWAVAKFGNIWYTENGGDTTVGIQQISTELPKKYTLHQNYPNPFNPETTIKFEIQTKSITELIVYDILGREVALLVNGILYPGVYEYKFNAQLLSGGVYFYMIKTEFYSAIKKMILLK